MTKLDEIFGTLEELLAERYLNSDSVTLKDYCTQLDILDLLRKTLQL